MDNASGAVVVGIDNGGTSNNATILDPMKGFLVDRLVETPSLVTEGPEAAIDAMARALDADERVIAEYVLAGGVAVAPVPPRLSTVEVLDADGTTVDQRAPMDVADLGV